MRNMKPLTHFHKILAQCGHSEMKLHLPFPFTGDSVGGWTFLFLNPFPVLWTRSWRWINSEELLKAGGYCSPWWPPDGLVGHVWFISRCGTPFDGNSAWCNSALELSLSEVSSRSTTAEIEIVCLPKTLQMLISNETFHGDECTWPSAGAGLEFHMFSVFALFRI